MLWSYTAEEGQPLTADHKDLKNCKSSFCLWTPTKNSRPLTCLQRIRNPEIPSLSVCMALEAARHALCNLRTPDDQALCILSRPPQWLSLSLPLGSRFPASGCQAAGLLAVVTPRKKASGRAQSRAGKAQQS